MTSNAIKVSANFSTHIQRSNLPSFTNTFVMELPSKSKIECAVRFVIIIYCCYIVADNFTALNRSWIDVNYVDDIAGTLRSDTRRINPRSLHTVGSPPTQLNDDITSLTYSNTTSLDSGGIHEIQQQESRRSNVEEVERAKEEEDNYATGDQTQILIVSFSGLHDSQFLS